MTGFEPATTRTPCVYATRLRHIPKSDCKNINFDDILPQPLQNFCPRMQNRTTHLDTKIRFRLIINDL